MSRICKCNLEENLSLPTVTAGGYEVQFAQYAGKTKNSKVEDAIASWNCDSLRRNHTNPYVNEGCGFISWLYFVMNYTRNRVVIE